MIGPNFLCIGAQKAGTTWLDKVLREHPDVWMPPMKEVHFFDYLFRDDFKKWIRWHLKATLKRELLKSFDEDSKVEVDWDYVSYLSKIATHENKFSLDWYQEIFKRGKGKICGEITPEYSCINFEGVNYIKDNFPALKIIYIIRDPVKRGWSQLKMNMLRNGELKPWVVKKTGFKGLDFDKNLEHPSMDDRGKYSRNIEVWDSVFKDILYIPFGQIKDDPQGLISRVEKFIGLEEFSNYSVLDKTVHKGAGLEAPKEVLDKLRNKYESEYDYLTKRFSEDFLRYL